MKTCIALLPATVILFASSLPMAHADGKSWKMTTLFEPGPAQIEPLISPRTRAILFAHIGGEPADSQGIVDLARKHKLPVIEDCSQAHGAVLHGCRVGRNALVGMNATVMDGAVLRAGVILGAGSLVPPGRELEGGYLWVGSPARRVRPLREQETAFLEYSARHYVELKNRHMAGG